MDRRHSGRLMLAGLIGLGAVSFTAMAALADNSPAQSAQVDTLISDIKAHVAMCSQVSPDQADLVTKCANEKGSLIQRQHDLGLSDAQVNNLISGGVKTRGWRWP